MDMDKVLEQLVSQILALVTFFAFPAIQYVLLKRIARKEGQPKLGYLPEYGFRLVIQNIPRKRFLRDIKYKVYIRKRIPPSQGPSVYTFYDIDVLSREEFFIFPKTDQTMLSFQLQGAEEDNIVFAVTDKLGKQSQEGVLLGRICKLKKDSGGYLQTPLTALRTVEIS